MSSSEDACRFTGGLFKTALLLTDVVGPPFLDTAKVTALCVSGSLRARFVGLMSNLTTEERTEGASSDGVRDVDAEGIDLAAKRVLRRSEESSSAFPAALFPPLQSKLNYSTRTVPAIPSALTSMLRL